MTCYQRHLGWMFEQLDLTYDRQNRVRVHRAIVELLELPSDSQCPVVWAALKDRYRTADGGFQSLASDVAGVLNRT